MIRAISLWQPWASLWLTQRKIHETRSWSTPHRGPLVVHAAKTLERHPGTAVAKLCVAEFGADWVNTLPGGAIIGIVTLEDCVSTDRDMAYNEDDFQCGDFSPGRFAWRRAPQIFKVTEPIPWRGMQGLFTVDCLTLDIVCKEMSP